MLETLFLFINNTMKMHGIGEMCVHIIGRNDEILKLQLPLLASGPNAIINLSYKVKPRVGTRCR